MKEELIFEIEENPEQRLVRLLKEKGAEDSEVKKILIVWTIEQEKQVEQLMGDAYSRAQIEFNLKRARLYFEAGYTEEAFENFEAARTQAWNEQRNELYQAIMKELDQIKDSMKK